MIYTPVDHPESNGRVERVGQSLINMLRCKFNEPNEARRWSSLIDGVVKQYNNTMHSVTRFPPVFLLTGEVDLPVSPIKESIDLEEARRQANRNSAIYHKRNKERIDRRRREHDFRVGESVYVKFTSKLNRKKLAEIRSGPYRITRAISDLVFELNTGKSKRANNVYHKNHLFPVIA